MEKAEGRSVAETPTWAVASVVSVMVVVGFSIQGSLKRLGKWLDRTKRKSVLAALEKIKEEIMLFGLLSLMMGHWIIFVSKICISSSLMSSKFYPCALPSNMKEPKSIDRVSFSDFNHLNYSVPRQLQDNHPYDNCPQGREPVASRESLEQLHRLLFVLGVTHVFYSFVAIALAMLKIYSWRKWENEAMSMVPAGTEGSATTVLKVRRLSTFIFHNTAHPWSQHKVLVWLLCFSRQFWSSINRADYMALRLGFISTHQLPLSYDFFKYMIRSMEEEFRDIVGISIPLWIFAILCMLLDIHGTNLYFWISFLPAILLLVVGTKLHRIVVKLAVEIMSSNPWAEFQRFNLRDELFWFGRPRFLLLVIQFISFQNALEMATFIWSLWEVEDPSCFMENRTYLAIRLSFGILSQVWCSYITFPLYVIVTQMGSRFKKSIISENVRRSLHGWRRRIQTRQGGSSHAFTLLTSTSMDDIHDNKNDIYHSNDDDDNDDEDDDSDEDDNDDIERNEVVGSSRREKHSMYREDNMISRLRASMGHSQTREISHNDEMLQEFGTNQQRSKGQGSARISRKDTLKKF